MKITILQEVYKFHPKTCCQIFHLSTQGTSTKSHLYIWVHRGHLPNLTFIFEYTEDIYQISPLYLWCHSSVPEDMSPQIPPPLMCGTSPAHTCAPAPNTHTFKQRSTCTHDKQPMQRHTRATSEWVTLPSLAGEDGPVIISINFVLGWSYF